MSDRLPTRRNLSPRELLLAAVAGLVAAMVLGGVARAQAGQPRIAVMIAPDLDSVPAEDQACPGCDGRFTTGDALRGNLDPLPPMNVQLFDHGGRLLQEAGSQAEQFGTQSVTFNVAAPGTFTIEVATPEGWRPCPQQPPLRTVSAADFGDHGAVRVEVGFWRGCLRELETARLGSSQDGVTSTVALTSAPTVVPSASGPRLPRAGTAVESSGRLMFGLAAAAVTFGLLGLAFETGLSRRS